MTKEIYLNNPCKTYALPYWKQKDIIIPDHFKIIHDSEFNKSYLTQYSDKQYFRLLHNLNLINTSQLITEPYYIRSVNLSSEKEIVVNMINSCYSTISVDLVKITNWTTETTFDNDLWIWIIDGMSNTPVALGIANFDPELKEGSLEWIQVMPEYRRKGLGQLIVTELLVRLNTKATFVTVSGEVDNMTNPENLYRKCGFVGHDIWHVLSKK
ncbi:MAG: GNAT family N-acetyltransferase [Turicibacter sp.]